MHNVPSWILVWAAAQTGLGLLWLVLRSVKRGSCLQDNGVPGNIPDLAVETDYMQRFPESRFE